jgi:hypothetical protein
VHLLQHYTHIPVSTDIQTQPRENTNPCRCKSCKSPYAPSCASSSRHQRVLCSSLRSSWQLWWPWMPLTWLVPWRRSRQGLCQRWKRATRIVSLVCMTWGVDAHFGCHWSWWVVVVVVGEREGDVANELPARYKSNPRPPLNRI